MFGLTLRMCVIWLLLEQCVCISCCTRPEVDSTSGDIFTAVETKTDGKGVNILSDFDNGLLVPDMRDSGIYNYTRLRGHVWVLVTPESA